jgi:uncharacterized LabA/DUF88 family protein
MAAQFARSPHLGRTGPQGLNIPHAALLIDFDNVTMGIRSDLTKELKNLLNSDIIKGKVAVQRAYADWRRYPQYIVPLAESSVDLIFAPAYGSAKKNATDIRLAIDALELVFTRQEIGTFILLSGDSDFSSLVLKLKEYGKYVIGVGIRESASDLLVQNCDEYYSYSALTGLTRAGDEDATVVTDPWELAERAVRQMVENEDVMRSDRLKQVILELDPNFDEKALGFTKFNRFVQEAASRGLLSLRKMENGQYEIGLATPEEAAAAQALDQANGTRRRGRRGRRGRDERPAAEKTAPAEAPAAAERPPEEPAAASPARPAAAASPARPAAAAAPVTQPGGPTDVRGAYDLLLRATGDLAGGRGDAVRDSDVKRRMLELQPAWDEGTLGFSKFSRFLRQAHDAEVIDLQKLENGNYEVKLPDGVAPISSARQAGERAGRGRERGRGRGGRPERGRPAEQPSRAEQPPPAAAQPAEAPAGTQATTPAAAKPASGAASPAVPPSRGLGFRRGSRRGAVVAAPPPLLEGQTIGVAPTAGRPQPQPAAKAAEPAKAADKRRPAKAGRETIEPRALRLPTKKAGVVKHLASYKGVGEKSAEALVAAVGADQVFHVLTNEPERARAAVGGRFGDRLIEAWQADFAERSRHAADGGGQRGRARSRAATPAKAAERASQAGPAPAATTEKARPARTAKTEKARPVPAARTEKSGENAPTGRRQRGRRGGASKRTTKA